MSPTNRRLVLVAVVCLLFGGVSASSAAAAARQKLPTGKELGSKWRSTKTQRSTLKDAQSFSAAQQAYETSGALRTFTRTLKGGRVEKATLIVHVTKDPANAIELFDQTAAQFKASGAVAGIGPFGEATSALRSGKGFTAIFRQGVVFASIYLQRSRGRGLPAKATVNAVGRAFAAKVAAVP